MFILKTCKNGVTVAGPQSGDSSLGGSFLQSFQKINLVSRTNTFDLHNSTSFVEHK